jgi:hypothetical protein
LEPIVSGPVIRKEFGMAKWVAITAKEMVFEEVGGADLNNGAIRYVFQMKDDGSFGTIEVDGRRIQPVTSMVFVQGNTIHVQVE